MSESQRDVAVDAVIRASRLCQAVQASLVTGSTMAKKDRSPVTVADFGAQAVVALALAEAFPDAPLVAEEDAAVLRTDDGAALREQVVKHVGAVVGTWDSGTVLDAIDRGAYGGGASGQFWTLDPIDGTKGFLRGDQYAVALALIKDGVPVLGVLGCPNLPLDAAEPEGPRGCLFVGQRGSGVVMRSIEGNGARPVSVTGVSDPALAAFCESVESAHSSHGDAAQIAARLGVTVPPFRIDSQCKYAAVARGDASIYLRLPTRKDYQEKIWDHAAGWIVVREAGGQVSDVRGQPLDFGQGRTLANNQGVIVTNGHLHDRVIEATRAVLGR